MNLPFPFAFVFISLLFHTPCACLLSLSFFNTNFFLHQFGIHLFFFFLSSLLLFTLKNRMGYFFKLVWVFLDSGTVLWQTLLNSLQIPSMFSCLNVFSANWCVRFRLCAITLLKDKEFICLVLSPYFTFTQWMWSKSWLLIPQVFSFCEPVLLVLQDETWCRCFSCCK